MNADSRKSKRVIWTLWFTPMVIAVSFMSCRRHSSPSAADAAEPGMTPSEVVMAVNLARTRGKLDAVPRSIAPGCEGDHVGVILALDQVLAANASLQRAIAERFGPASATDFDLSDMGESFGVFSLNVRVVKEVVEGERAIVTIQEGTNVPLRDVVLSRHDERWLVHLEQPERGLIDRLQKLARTLDQMRAMLDRPGSSYSDLAASFRLQVWPQLQSMATGQ